MTENDLGQDVARRALPMVAAALWRRRRVLASAIIATVTVNFLALATSLYSMQIYDRVIPRSGYATLWALTIGVLIALLLDFGLRTARAMMIEREAAHVDAEVSQSFFAQVQAVRLDARPGGIGTIAAQLRGWEQVRALLSSASIFLLADLPFALLFIAVIAWLGGEVALVPLIALPVALTMALIFARLIRNDADRAQISGNRKNGLLVESLDAAEIVKASNGGAEMEARWQALNETLIDHEEPVKRWSAIAAAVFASLQQLSYVLVVAWGAVRVSEGAMTMGALIACTILSGRVNGPLVTQLPNFFVQWSYSRSALRALDMLLALPRDGSTGGPPLRPETVEPSLRAENLQFAYPGDAGGQINVPALSIAPGERVAIIGGIGSGKSTLLRLLAGLYLPASGSVRLGGLDVHQIDAQVLRRNLAYLPQDTRLLDGTLRQNLQLGMGDVGDDRIIGALQAVGLADMVAHHPRGVDLPISEGGRGLSGGQRMLANLARLMILDPRVWLLDEPTANLDQVAEARIIAELQSRMTPDRTLVFATHRLRNLALSTRVIVMNAGTVVMDGPTDAVLQKMAGEQARMARQNAAASPATPTPTTPASVES